MAHTNITMDIASSNHDFVSVKPAVIATRGKQMKIITYVLTM